MQKIAYVIGCFFLFCHALFGASRDQLSILKNDIQRIVHHVDKKATVGIDVISLSNGERLFSCHSDLRLIPASLAKLFTLGAGFELLGTNYVFKTALYTDGVVEKGVLLGNLYVKGSGDPTLSTRHLEGLIHRLSLIGIQEIRGSIILDDSAFDSISMAPGWMVEDNATPLSALSLNQNCIDLWIRPGLATSSPTQIVKDHHFEDLPCKIDNQALTIESKQNSRNLKVITEMQEDQPVIQVTGHLGLHDLPKHHRVTVSKTASMVGVALQGMLKNHAVICQGGIHQGITPATALMLTEHASLPFAAIGRSMCKESDNFFSDCIFKALGREVKGSPGSWQTGSQAVRDYLIHKVKLNADNLVLLDGCGLSRYNLISPSNVVSFLAWVHQNPLYNHEFKAALPVAGIDGTLKKRLVNLRGRLRAKTGTMTGISTLAGYLFTRDNEELAFAIMVNGTVKNQSEIREKLIDPICERLAVFSRR